MLLTLWTFRFPGAAAAESGVRLSWLLQEGLTLLLWGIPMCVVLWLMGHTTQRHTLGAEFARLCRGRWFRVLLGLWVASACAYAVLLAVV
jgi:SNF family Na+-dependent transporter